MAELQDPIAGQQEKTRDELNVILERLNHSSQQLTDVKRQVAITGQVIDLYWQLESKSITPEDYRRRLMYVLQDW